MSTELTDACHLWQVDLTSAVSGAHLLAADERARAARFRFDRHRERFIACRVALRKILGSYLQREPESIVLRVGEHGRPHLVETPGLEFNVSHSDTLALIAVSAAAPLGVDIEALREVERVIDLARRYLHPDELCVIEAAPPANRSSLFLTCWTRKEAVLKSTGAGLTRDTRTLYVGTAATQDLLELPHFPPLRTISLVPADGYVAACASAAGVQHFELRRFDA